MKVKKTLQYNIVYTNSPVLSIWNKQKSKVFKMKENGDQGLKLLVMIYYRH
jgi:hypothetical protein